MDKANFFLFDISDHFPQTCLKNNEILIPHGVHRRCAEINFCSICIKSLYRILKLIKFCKKSISERVEWRNSFCQNLKLLQKLHFFKKSSKYGGFYRDRAISNFLLDATLRQI